VFYFPPQQSPLTRTQLSHHRRRPTELQFGCYVLYHALDILQSSSHEADSPFREYRSYSGGRMITSTPPFTRSATLLCQNMQGHRRAFISKLWSQSRNKLQKPFHRLYAEFNADCSSFRHSVFGSHHAFLNMQFTQF